MHLRAVTGEFQHLLATDLRQFAGVGNDARVRRVDAVDVGVDLAALRLEGGGERDGGRVRAAAPKRRDVAVLRDALKARDDDDAPRVEHAADGGGVERDDGRAPVRRVGANARLRAAHADRLLAEVAERHRHQRARDDLAGGEQHIQFARIGRAGDRFREFDEAVGRVAHRGDDDHDVGARAAGRGHALGGAADLFRVAKRRASVLLNDDGGHQVNSGGPAAGSAPFGAGSSTRYVPVRPDLSPASAIS